MDVYNCAVEQPPKAAPAAKTDADADADADYTFVVPAEEREAYDAWVHAHFRIGKCGQQYAGAIGGALTVSFTSTSIGHVVTAKCGLCGKAKDFSGLL